MSETNADIEYFAQNAIVHIATTTESGREAVTPIWAVVIDGTPYIRNGYGGGSKWYGRVTSSGSAAFADGDRRIPVRVEHIVDAADISRVDDAYSQKYRDQAAPLAMMLGEQQRADTLRLSLAAAG